ncbi:MAG: hypothetical protein JO295_15160 [Verrucomicrobia bacterium]|nr:hypothetical protein [Verrucomicrobiota bacterium]
MRYLALLLLLFVLGCSKQPPADRCASNARQINLACRLYSDDHDGNFPHTLQELVGSPYLKDNTLLICPLSPRREPIGYDYFGGKTTDLDSKPLLRAKHTWPDGHRVTVYIDGHMDIKSDDKK